MRECEYHDGKNPECQMCMTQQMDQATGYAIATLNRFWSATKFNERAYSAKRDDGETRLYFSREALERDFGLVTFSGE